MKTGTHKMAIWLACFSVLLQGCLFDSSYWQQKSAQRNVAQQNTPRVLEATPATSSGSPNTAKPTVLKLRAHATPSYVAEVAEWPRQLSRLIEDANRILEPTLNVRLEVVDARTWNTHLSSDSLDALLVELHAIDRGDDVDGVVGLVGSLPIFTHTFHQLGMGDLMGKHVAMRAMNDAREREAIETILSRLPEDEREALYQTRKRHKATAVFLHEIGHNFGLIHEADASSLMSTRYDKAMTAFSPSSAELMRLTALHRSPGARQTERAFAEQLLAEFEKTQSAWVAAEREAMVASLKARLASGSSSPPASSGQPPNAAPADSAALKDVAPTDRSIYSDAMNEVQAGRAQDAWTKAEPLFSRYPDVYAIQDLRCKLALKLTPVWEEARRECARLMDLSRGPPAAKQK